MKEYEQPIKPQAALPRQGVQEARIYDGFHNAYPFADTAVAQSECGVRGRAEVTDCPECLERVILHCGQCKVQVTGCYCTDLVVSGKEFADAHRKVRPSSSTAGLNRAQRRIKEREMRRSGSLWTPSQIHR